MKKLVKVLSILMIFAIIPVLTACGDDKNKSKKEAPADLNVNIEKVAEAYLNAYIGKEADLDGTGLEKEELQGYVYRRDYHIVDIFSSKDGKDAELLKAYREAIKNVEYSIKSSDIREVVINIKGVDISGIKNAMQSHMMKVKREREITVEELRAEGENKAIEALKSAPVLEEKEVKLSFVKDDDKLKIAPSSIESLENSVSYLEEDYIAFRDEVPQEFKDIEVK